MKILVTDDSEDNRFLVSAYLKSTRCSIDFAENGKEAVELFSRNRYDVLLMDGEMPVMDGYTAVREIRRLESANPLAAESRQSTPIFAFTAHAFADMAAMALDAGYTHMLTKPLRRVKLLEALAKYGRTPEAAQPLTVAADNADRIAISVEPDMRDAVPGYLEKRRTDLSSCYKALAEGNLPLIAGIGHKMKGTGAGFGFPFLTEMGGKLEAAARGAKTDEVKTTMDELASWFERVDLEIR
jgi:CheY-like chemotaxis protein